MTAADAAPELVQPTRLVDGRELPIPGSWKIDPGHSSLAFEARHAVVTRMRGRFRAFEGEFHIAEDPEASWVEVTIQAASIDTTHETADEHLREEHYLDAANHPTLHFRSTRVRPVGENWQVDGDLTIKGITRPITLDATFEGAVALARGPKAKMAFSVSGQFDRRDYGMEANFALPGGGWIVGTGVRLHLDVEADLS